MTDLDNYLSTFQWLYFHEKENPDRENPHSALAYQDTFVRWILELNQNKGDEKPFGVFHFYPSDYAMVYLGAKDTRLPRIQRGIEYLEDRDHRTVVRPHGGLAVINDPGILNVALVSDTDYFPLSIDEGYEQMVALIQASLESYGIDVVSYEIEDSYCPGKYDVVVDGRKIGGIAQRRFKSGVATAAYLSVNGNQERRGELIQSFYRIGDANDDYPTVNPESMTTISEIIGENITVAQYENMLIEIMESKSVLHPGNYQDQSLVEQYDTVLNKTYRRTNKAKNN